MQFFEHQDQARGRSTLLVVLFTFSVLLLGAVTGAAVHFSLIADLEPGEPRFPNHWNFVATAAIITWGIIFLGSAYRLAQLRGGGVKVAEALGGTLVTAQSPDLLERRVVNIVEEMAIASGLPVPPVYVMQQETGINAFAAGWSPDDAVIGVTKGALEALRRDQLQGVIAHEFSHILNRDCALNIRLMGILHGIVVISVIGRMLMQIGSGGRHRSSRSDGTFQFLLLGMAIWLFGSLGVLVARTIQAAVSRQREYLADASAVQFTRNPEGIAGALATIGSQSSALTSPHSGETSHMLIGEPGSTSFLSALASHPPLFERIQRILPNWDGDFAAIATPPGTVRQLAEKTAQQKQVDGAQIAQDLLLGGLPGLPLGTGPADAVVAGAVLEELSGPPSALVSQARRVLDSTPPRLRNAAGDPFAARALIVAWVLDDNEADRAAQMALVGADAPLAQEVERLERDLPALDPVAILPLFDIALGTLVALSPTQKTDFYELLFSVSGQLNDRSYRGYCLASLALRHLDEDGVRTKRSSMLIKVAIETILGVLAAEGHDSRDEAEAAFVAGAQNLGKRGKSLRLPESNELTVSQLDAALSTLLRLPTVTRAELLNAAEEIASHDGVLRPSEAELLRTLATCLNVATEPAFATDTH